MRTTNSQAHNNGTLQFCVQIMISAQVARSWYFNVLRCAYYMFIKGARWGVFLATRGFLQTANRLMLRWFSSSHDILPDRGISRPLHHVELKAASRNASAPNQPRVQKHYSAVVKASKSAASSGGRP